METAWAEAVGMGKDIFLTWMAEPSPSGHQRRLRSPLLCHVSDFDRWLVLKATTPTRVKRLDFKNKTEFESAVFTNLDQEFMGKKDMDLSFFVEGILADL